MELNPNNEPDASTSFLGTNKPQKKRKLWILIAVVFTFVTVITVISLILYSQIYIDEDERLHLVSQSNMTTFIFTGSLQITDSCVWTPPISDESMLSHLVTNAYQSSPALKYYFISANVTSANDEDYSANFTLNFSISSNTQKEIKYMINKEFVGGILSQDIYDHEIKNCENLNIVISPFDLTLSHD
ncbi:TPA-induced transmembrane protein [Bombina bombina]|uniref:TPA-induced transmembrane protein n=1 Tax=Bombina bombina TaxID=8345 RepID=UPI00235A94AF|nr:TPA-induced transmembrane protein [Bombina bombina]